MKKSIIIYENDGRAILVEAFGSIVFGANTTSYIDESGVMYNLKTSSLITISAA